VLLLHLVLLLLVLVPQPLLLLQPLRNHKPPSNLQQPQRL
jgi:hypothetical protein